MVVDDDLFTQRLVKNSISKHGDVVFAADGCRALELYVAKAPDILFLDIELPDTTGHEVLEKIFQLDPHAFVVMLSGNGDRDNVLKAVEIGASGFVGKPFPRNRLCQYIEKSPFIIKKQEENHACFIN